jgi:DNA-binding beta-propeller fold protein YncE
MLHQPFIFCPAVHFRPFCVFVFTLLMGLFANSSMEPVAAQTGKTFQSSGQARRSLYVVSPGIRDYLQYGGHGILVFDIDDHHKFVRRISLDGNGIDEQGKPINVKGVCASAETRRLYVSTKRQLICLDISTDTVLWQREYPLGCDRMSISPDGLTIYQPSFENDRWYVLNADDGSIKAEVVPDSKAHNTVYAVDGSEAYLAGLRSDLLTVTDATTHKVSRTIGPFSGSIRPFTVNGDRSLVFVNVNGLLGFEIGDLKTGKKLHRVEITGVARGKPLRHGCPSHGIGMTPDESQIWVSDGFNSTMHMFNAKVMPPKLTDSVKLRGQPGWVTFSIDGTIGWPSTGQAIDVRTHKIIAELTDEKGRAVESEKVLEVDLRDGKVVAVGDQFGCGQQKHR